MQCFTLMLAVSTALIEEASMFLQEMTRKRSADKFEKRKHMEEGLKGQRTLKYRQNV